MQGEIRVTVIATGFDKAVQPGLVTPAHDGRTAAPPPRARRSFRSPAVPSRARRRHPPPRARDTTFPVPPGRRLRRASRVAGRRISATWRSRPSFGDRWIEDASQCSRHHLRRGGAAASSSRSATRPRAPRASPPPRSSSRATPPRPSRRRPRGRRRASSAQPRRDAHRPAQARRRQRPGRAGSRARRHRRPRSNTRYLRAGMPVDVTADSAGEDAARARVPPRHRPPAAHDARPATGWVGTEERLPWTTDTVVVGGTIHANLYQAMDSSAAQYFPARAKDELAWATRRHLRVSRGHEPRPPGRRRVPRARRALRRPGGRRRRWARCSPPRSPSRAASSRPIRFEQRAAEPAVLRRHRQVAARRVPARAARVPPHLAAPSARASTRSSAAGRRTRGRTTPRRPGTPVRAIGDAVVVRAGWSNGYGNLLELRHRNGYVTRYGHLRGFAKGVRPARAWASAQTVGYVGTTGLSTGPHLHFEVLDGRRAARLARRRSSHGRRADPRRRERGAFEARARQLLAVARRRRPASCGSPRADGWRSQRPLDRPRRPVRHAARSSVRCLVARALPLRVASCGMIVWLIALLAGVLVALVQYGRRRATPALALPRAAARPRRDAHRRAAPRRAGGCARIGPRLDVALDASESWLRAAPRCDRWRRALDQRRGRERTGCMRFGDSVRAGARP